MYLCLLQCLGSLLWCLNFCNGHAEENLESRSPYYDLGGTPFRLRVVKGSTWWILPRVWVTHVLKDPFGCLRVALR